MSLEFESIFRELEKIREQNNIPLIHVPLVVNTENRFVIYNAYNFFAKNPVFHIMACIHVRRAARDGNIKFFKRTSELTEFFRMMDGSRKKLKVCNNCIREWNNHHVRPENAKNFSLYEFFQHYEYNPEIWQGISIPPEINGSDYIPGCFVLYIPGSTLAGFHFMECSIVNQDKSDGWLQVYRLINRNSGKFEDDEGQMKKFKVCKHCLAEWNNNQGWKGFNFNMAQEDQQEAVDSFDIDEFFRQCDYKTQISAELVNIIWKGTGARNIYPKKSWNAISKIYRLARQFRCEQCGLDLSQHHELLVVHHVNGYKPDVRAQNLRVLCKWCHSKQPHHDRTVLLHRSEVKEILSRKTQDAALGEIYE